MNSFKSIIRKELRLGDLVVVLIAMIGIAISIIWISKPKDSLRVFIYKDNLLWGDYAISIDRNIVIDEHNHLEIKNGKVRMSYADCADKRCMKQGFSNHLPIICMPNRIIVEIGTAKTHHKLILQ